MARPFVRASARLSSEPDGSSVKALADAFASRDFASNESFLVAPRRPHLSSLVRFGFGSDGEEDDEEEEEEEEDDGDEED